MRVPVLPFGKAVMKRVGDDALEPLNSQLVLKVGKV